MSRSRFSGGTVEEEEAMPQTTPLRAPAPATSSSSMTISMPDPVTKGLYGASSAEHNAWEAEDIRNRRARHANWNPTHHKCAYYTWMLKDHLFSWWLIAIAVMSGLEIGNINVFSQLGWVWVVTSVPLVLGASIPFALYAAHCNWKVEKQALASSNHNYTLPYPPLKYRVSWLVVHFLLWSALMTVHGVFYKNFDQFYGGNQVRNQEALFGANITLVVFTLAKYFSGIGCYLSQRMTHYCCPLGYDY